MIGPLLSSAAVLAALSATAASETKTVEVGDEVSVVVRAWGTGLTRVTITPPDAPGGLDIGPMDGPHVDHFVEGSRGQQVQAQGLVWYVKVTPTSAGAFTVPPFTVSNGNDIARTKPFELRAVGSFDARRFAFVETRVDPRPRYVGEPIEVVLVAGVADEWKDRMTDGSTRIGVDWMFDGLSRGSAPGSDPWPGAAEVTAVEVTAMNGLALRMMPGTERRAGGRFSTWTASRRFVPTKPGRVRVGPSTFQTVIATRVERDRFFRDRLYASQTKLARVTSPEVAIDVKPLPEAGRTDAFSGLVGRGFVLEATAERAGRPAVGADPGRLKVRVGESLRVRLRVAGDGNLSTTPLPRVEIDGFKRFGVIEEIGSPDEAPWRTLVYDLAPVSTDVREVPAFTLEVFDTEAGAYRRLSSRPIAVEVLPGGAISSLADLPAPGAAPSGAHAGGGAAAGARWSVRSVIALFPGGAAGIAAVFLVPALAFGAWSLATGRTRPAGTPPRASGAAGAPLPATPAMPPRPFAESMASLPASGAARAKAVLDSFAHYLAALAQLPPETFIGVELEEALSPFVRDTALRREASALVAEAERAAFGGAPVARDLAARAERLAAALQRAFVVPSHPRG